MAPRHGSVRGRPRRLVDQLGSDGLANKPAFALTGREMRGHIKQTVRSAVAEASAAPPASNQTMWLTVKQAHRLLDKSDRCLLQQLHAGTIH